MNKETLQNYNSILSENNLSLADINSTINELPDVSNLMEKFEITNATYLFYKGARMDAFEEIIKLCKNVKDCYNMFAELPSKYTEIDLSSFDTSQVTGMNYMFYYSYFATLDLSNFNTSSVTRMNNMFDNCSKLTELDLSNFDTLQVTNMTNMFYNCSLLTLLDLSNFNTSNVTNMNGMFHSCRNLINLDLSSFDFSKINNISTIFSNDSALTNLIFGNNLGKGYTSKTNNLYNYQLNLSFSTNLTHDSLMSVINGLYDLNLTYDVANGGTLYTQQLILGATNIAKLSSEELAIATNKGWVVS